MGKLNGSISALKQEINNAKAENDDIINKREAKFQEYANQINQQATIISAAKEENLKLTQVNDSLKSKFEEANNLLNTLQNQLNENKTVEKVMKEDYDDIFLQYETVLATKEEQAKQMIILIKENKNAKAINTQLSDSVQTVSKEKDIQISKLKDDLSKINADMLAREQALASVKSENDKMRQTLMNDRITELTLRDQITTLQLKASKR